MKMDEAKIPQNEMLTQYHHYCLDSFGQKKVRKGQLRARSGTWKLHGTINHYEAGQARSISLFRTNPPYI